MTNPAECPPEQLDPVLARLDTDSEGGLAALERLLDQFGSDARLHFLRGSVLASLQRYDEATVAMTQAVGLAPDFAIARFQLGLLHLTSGRASQAAEILEPLTGLGADEALRHFAEGLRHLTQGEIASAEASLRHGIALETDNPALHRDMRMMLAEIGKVNTQTGDADEPLSAVQQLLQRYPGSNVRH